MADINSYANATPILTDKLLGTDDPGGTPLTRNFLFSAIRDLVQANLTKATIAGGVITADAPLIDGTVTWNNVAVTFNADKINVTDTLSAAASTLFDRQVGGVSQAKIDKDGQIFAGAGKFSMGVAAGGSQFNIWNPSGTRTALNGTSLEFTVGGTYAFNATAGGIAMSATAGAALDAFLLRDAADNLAMRNGVTPQAFSIYNTFTDASNYERARAWYASNIFNLMHEAAGTGSTARSLKIGTTGGGVVDIAVSNIARFRVSNSTVQPLLPLAMGSNYIDMTEMTPPAAPGANVARLFVDVSGVKSKLMVQFQTGAAIQLAIEV